MYSVFPYAICNLCAIFSSNGLSLFIALCWAKCRYCTWCKGLARRVVQLAYESALSSLYIKNSKHESLPSIGCLSWFMFYMRKNYHRKAVCISLRTSFSCPPPRFIGWADITDYFVEVIINKKVLQVWYLQDSYVAGVGPEPTTSGLWIRRSNQLSYPAIVVCGCKGTLNFWIFQIKIKLFFLWLKKWKQLL